MGDHPELHLQPAWYIVSLRFATGIEASLAVWFVVGRWRLAAAGALAVLASAFGVARLLAPAKLGCGCLGRVDISQAQETAIVGGLLLLAGLQFVVAGLEANRTASRGREDGLDPEPTS